MKNVLFFFLRIYFRNRYTYFYLLSYYSFIVLNLILDEFQKVSSVLIYPILLSILTLWNEDKGFKMLYNITSIPRLQFIHIKFTIILLLSIFHFSLFKFLTNSRGIVEHYMYPLMLTCLIITSTFVWKLKKQK